MTIFSHFQRDKLLSSYSTFKIGGPARFFLEVCDVHKMQETLCFCHAEKLPYFILGKGSNSLFDDQGFCGLVIHNKISYLSIKETLVDVGAGYSFSLLGVQTAKRGLSGLEFASGIPASVGGAIFMNAGAGGEETAHHLVEVSFVTEQGELEILARDQLQFSYRESSFQKRRGAIVSARFHLTHKETAREKQLNIIDYRTKTQPYEEPSIGCIFKNPPGHSAGALIETCGLKGAMCGGAAVSHKHANFIVNKNQATAQDVLKLSNEVRQAVFAKTGIWLELEVRCIPYLL